MESFDGCIEASGAGCNLCLSKYIPDIHLIISMFPKKKPFVLIIFHNPIINLDDNHIIELMVAALDVVA